MLDVRPWEALPDEFWEAIFGRLNHHRHLESVSLVNKRFLAITNHGRTTITLPFLHRLLLLLPLPQPHLPAPPPRPPQPRPIRPTARPIQPPPPIPLPPGRHALFGRSMHDTLKSLSCTWFKFITDAEPFVIAGCFSYLERLDIGHSGSPLDRSRQMTDQGVCAISVKLKCLRFFNILSHGYLSSRSIESLSSNCPLLSDPISVPAFPTVAIHTWITFPLTSRACVFIVAFIG